MNRRRGDRVFGVFLCLSLLIHLLVLYLPVSQRFLEEMARRKERTREPVQITLVPLPETREKPNEKARLGPATHKAEKERRRKAVPRESSGGRRALAQSTSKAEKELEKKQRTENKTGELEEKQKKKQLALLPTRDPGKWKDERTERHILDEALKEEETVDLNTTEFKYISYFSKLKNMIEMVWVYPYSAIMRGEEGTVTLRFTIERTGRLSGVEVVRSSGVPELDTAAVNAVKEASPFPPLPHSWKIKRLNVVGEFHYILGYRFVR